MMLGTAICMSAMLLLGFTRAVASIFTGWDNDSVRLLVNHTPFISHCNIMCSARMTRSRFGLLFSLFISSTSPSMQVICHTREFSACFAQITFSSGSGPCPSRGHTAIVKSSCRKCVGCSHVGCRQRRGLLRVSAEFMISGLILIPWFRGNINLPKILPFLGRSQLQVLSVVVSFLLLAGHLLMATLVKERVLLKTSSVDGYEMPFIC